MNWHMPDIDRSANVWLSEYGWRVIRPEHFNLGIQTDIGAGTVILCQQGVEIGDKAQIGPNCSILSISTICGKQGKVTIGKDARVGANSVILPGVTIGEKSIIGAGSVVTTNVPAGEVWYGTPARFRRTL
jgi:maltose O-acetyltransferase